MKSIGIIGGGIIGLSSAYYLTKAGHRVTVIDKGSFDEGCSFGNAGMIVPSHFIPLAAPGMIAKGIRWMFNADSPFYVRPRLDPALLRWGYLFYKNATKENVSRAIPAMKALSLLGKSLYREWQKELPFDFGYHERGLMMLYKTSEVEKEERETAHMANQFGIEAKILNPDEVQALEPDVRVEVKGGVYFPGDAHLAPHVLVGQLVKFLAGQGVTFIDNAEVSDFQVDRGEIDSVMTSNGTFSFDEVILATGSWSGRVGRQLGLDLPMQAGKGYSFTLEAVPRNIRIPSIFVEARVAVTPMGNSLRFGGTMEIAGINHDINMNRVSGIVKSIPSYFPDMKVDIPSQSSIWHGLRPCSPDGLPYIGRAKAIKNLIVATGHAMMGLSLGPATGKIVSDLVAPQRPVMDIAAFDPDRFE